MRPAYTLNKLDVVGYANVLTDDTVPSVVAPIFRHKDNKQEYLFPPFTIDNNQLLNSTVSTERDFQRLINESRVTSLPAPVPAKSNYELWIDEKMEARYERATRAHKNLTGLAVKYTEQAEEKLQKGLLEDADFLCSRAISAKENYIEAWAIKAAIRKKQGRHQNFEFLADAVSIYCSKNAFSTLVDSFVLKAGDAQDALKSKTGKHERSAICPMRDFALIDDKKALDLFKEAA